MNRPRCGNGNGLDYRYGDPDGKTDGRGTTGDGIGRICIDGDTGERSMDRMHDSLWENQEAESDGMCNDSEWLFPVTSGSDGSVFWWAVPGNWRNCADDRLRVRAGNDGWKQGREGKESKNTAEIISIDCTN